MAGHNLQITIKSANQIDSITISDEGVDLLMPGTPAETVATARVRIVADLLALIASKRTEVRDKFVADNVTVST